jgi:hypothetical protein
MRVLFIFCVVRAGLAGQDRVGNDAGWPNYGNDPGGTRYSPAKQINRSHVPIQTLRGNPRTTEAEK